MKRGKPPDKGRRRPGKREAQDAAEGKPKTQEHGRLVPPSRRPPTAVGAGTPPPPTPPRRRPASPEPHGRPMLSRLVRELRAAADALLNVADATAAAILKSVRREG